MSLNPNISHWECSFCGTRYATDQVMNLCPHDQRPLQIHYHLDAIKQSQWYYPETNNMWRFAGLLPISHGYHTFGEGHTPLLDYSDHGLAKKHGFELFIKDAGKSLPGFGQHPTLSFKDRGISVVVNMARPLGTAKLAVRPPGNARD